jgi:hypothetical protein
MAASFLISAGMPETYHPVFQAARCHFNEKEKEKLKG